jgi:predicted transcriptional regulator
MVKTTVELPHELWRAVKILAMDAQSDLRGVIISALEDYLRKQRKRGGG